ncbi:MAG: hypothetical protein WAU36_04270 [Cyclobacteriaceae bacterium]
MKVFSNRNAAYYSLFLIATAFSVMAPDLGFAQTLSDFDQAVKTEATSFKSIARTIIDIILVLGAIGVIYAYVTKRQDAKDYLIYYLIGVVILGVLRTTVLA